MGDDDIEKLTTSMAAGDERAVEVFYRRYFDWLYAQARKETGRDESFCLDVVQDAVLRIIRTVHPVKAESQLLSWMRLVVRTTALDQFRSEQRRGKRQALLIEFHSCDDFPYGLFDGEQLDWLKGQLDRFDPQLAQIIDLRFEKQWTLAKIAEKLGLSIGAIDGRLRRAIKELHIRAIKEFGDE